MTAPSDARTIDRLAPGRRPEGPAAGWQRWRRLLFLHWTFPAELVRPLVPASLELDLHEEKAYVGLVPFAMERVRPRWLPGFAAMDFLETNVRTYVVRDGVPGVYFFSLDAASLLAVVAARATFGLPYFHARMRMEDEPAGSIRYETTRTGSEVPTAVRYRVGEARGHATPGTRDHFLIERYWLFVERGGVLHRAQVHHTPYPIHDVELLELEQGLLREAGLPAIGKEELACAHGSPGVDVEVFSPTPV